MAVQTDCIVGHNTVQPAAAAFAAGSGAEFPAFALQFVADRIKKFGGERTASDPGGVRL